MVKKIIAFAVSLLFVVSATAFCIHSEEKTLVYTAIGDSIAAGYRLPKYTGDGKITDGGYVSLFADGIGATKVNDKAVSGSDTADTLRYLNNSAYSDAIAEADVITVSMGSNDLLSPGQDIIMEALGITSMGDLGSVLAADSIGGIRKISEYAKKDEQKARLTSAVESFKTNWVAMIDKIVELNPDATVVVSNYYNPYAPLSSLASNGVDIDKTVDAYLGQMNEFITSHRYNGKLYEVADVTAVGIDKTNVNLVQREMDPHPNAAGHIHMYEKMLAAYKTAVADSGLMRPEQTTTLPQVTTTLPEKTTTLPVTTNAETTAIIPENTTAEVDTTEEKTPADETTTVPTFTSEKEKNGGCSGFTKGIGVSLVTLALAFLTAVSVVIRKK